MADSVLSRFRPQVSTWFSDVFAAPTAVQESAWREISEGKNALVVAPTGSGKTLAAFLWAINSLVVPEGQLTLTTNSVGASRSAIPARDKGAGVRVLYISPLKALGVDVESNLHAPLLGISRTAEKLGQPVPQISIGVRSGDTPQSERSRQVRNPPDILITTPESLYLMLTSKAKDILSSVDTVIVDEIHALAGTKRGVHLALSLERLVELVSSGAHPGHVQRIGLSATVRPLERVASFLSGVEPVSIVAPAAEKRWDLTVHVPVEDMSDLPTPEVGSRIGSSLVDDPHSLTVPIGSEEDDDGDDEDDVFTRGPVVPSVAGVAGVESVAGIESLASVESVAGEPSPTPLVSVVPDPARSETPAETETPTPIAAPVAEDSALPTSNSIWPFIEQQLFEEVMEHDSTLVFVNSRRSAERLTSRLNELYATKFAPEALNPPARRDPAQLMKQTDVAGAAAPVIARAHHGSVSKEERALTEDQLKSGELKAVVSTSSLELGIDMGAVGLVIQVESPPSVASGLQRVGRAGHAVGAISEGSFYPKHRADLVQTAVTVERMRRGLIEELTVPRNALDVLLQQTVAHVSQHDISADAWFDIVRRAYPYTTLDREVFDSVIDLASGAYPSTDFADLKPRIVFDRVTGMLSARPGAQRVAVLSGGTIPDRGLFGVFLVGGGEGSAPRRVGALDEEMVYESRVGDVFTLGATSWRIEEITRDQVLVTPAPGHTGRLPFWSGGQEGRPAELGEAVGEFRREAVGNRERLSGLGLDQWAEDNLLQFLSEQQEATGVVPDEKTLVLERFRDELGDWRVVLHSPYGRGVNAAWALAVGARVAELTGMDAQAVAGDDGIVLRLPEGDKEPGSDLFFFDPDEIESLVTERVGNSALFASRFRECASRALLLPRRNPGKRAPLWQQRQRAEQLLDVARKYPSFPIILETVRECMQDVYDIDALIRLMKNLRLRQVRIAEVTTDQPSPFSSSLLFNYTGGFMYEGDTPLAEKRAAALALDPSLLAKLLGTVELRELLSQEVIDEVDRELRRVADGRRARTPEEFADTLRIVGPIPVDQVSEHVEFGEGERALALIRQHLGNRVMEIRFGGRDHVALAQDAALIRDGLGVPIPAGVTAKRDEVPDALEQLVNRFARSRGPFTSADVAHAFGVGVSVVHGVIRQLVHSKKLVEGHFREGVEELEYCAADVLRKIRTRSLAAARAEAEPVSHSAFARFLPQWQQVAPVGVTPALRGEDGVFSVIEQLAGVRLPASAWESVVLPSRVGDYAPQMLDALTSDGEVLIVGAGSAGAQDPWIMLLPAEYAPQLIPEQPEATLTAVQESILEVVSRGGGYFFPQIVAEVRGGEFDLGLGNTVEPATVQEAMWGLVELGLLSPDTFEPVRARLNGGKTAHKVKRRPRRSRLRMGRTSFSHSQRPSTPPDMQGRWSVPPAPETEPTNRSVAHGEAWLDRYGVVTRGSVANENVIGGFALAYKVLSGFEETGKAMRGYVVEGLGAAQFSTPAVIDRIRAHSDSADVDGWPSGTKEPQTYVLAATDPANPYGAALPWPEGAHVTRSAGALVVLVDGLLTAHLTRGGRVLTTFFDGLPEPVESSVQRVVTALESVSRVRFNVEKLDGEPALTSPLTEAFRRAGAGITPKGIRIGGHRGTASVTPGTRATPGTGVAPGARGGEDDGSQSTPPLVRTRRRGGYPRARR